MYFTEITEQIKDGTDVKITGIERSGVASLFMFHLNSQIRKYGGLTPCRRVFDRGSKNSDRHGGGSAF